MWAVVNMIEVGKGSCYRRVEGVVIPYYFWWAAQVGSPASISRYYRVEGHQKLKHRQIKKAEWITRMSEGRIEGSGDYVSKSFSFCTTDIARNMAIAWRSVYFIIIIGYGLRFYYTNAHDFKLSHFSVPCYKSVDLLQILLPGGSDCWKQFVVLKHSTGLMFRSVQQPPYLPIEFSVGINTIHSVKLSLKNIFSLWQAYSLKLRTILYFSGYAHW